MPVRRNAVVGVTKVIAARTDMRYRPPTNHEVGRLARVSCEDPARLSLMDASVYFGVECRGCDNRIPLVEVISGPRIYQWFLPKVPPFEVRCESCGTSRTYRHRHVIVFEAPTLDNLETHPAFRYV